MERGNGIEIVALLVEMQDGTMMTGHREETETSSMTVEVVVDGGTEIELIEMRLHVNARRAPLLHQKKENLLLILLMLSPSWIAKEE